MIGRRWLVPLTGLVPGLVVGCQSPRPAPYSGEDPVDGSRLVALRFSDASDGAPLAGLRTRIAQSSTAYPALNRNAQAWFDRELGQQCRFEGLSDGSVRCVPDGAILDAVDETCTHWVAHVLPGCDAPAHVLSLDMLALGERISSGFHRGLGPHGSPLCLATTGEYYRLGDRVANSLFAAADEVARPGVELDFVDFVTGDGAREIAGVSWRDGTPVEPVRVSRTEMAFLPVANPLALSRPEYLDPACTRMAINEGAPGTIVNLWFATDPCRPVSCLRGASMTVDTLHVRQGGQCVAVAGPRRVEECTDLAATAPRFSIELRPGAGRLRRFDHVSAAGDRVPGGVFDTEQDARCTPTLIDGGARAVCVPDGAAGWRPRAISEPDYGSIYSDAACSQEAFVAYACGAAPPITADAVSRWCREPVAEVRLHTSVVTAPLYIRTTTGCVRYEPAPGVTIYDGAATVPVPDLPELTLGHP